MKLSRVFPLVLVALMVFLLAGVALAGDKTPEPKKADVSKMSGKDLYKSRCKVCHLEDSEAGEYTPMSLIQEQWEDFFDGEFAETHKGIACKMDMSSEKHTCTWETVKEGATCCPKDAQMVPDMFNKDMLKKIKKFCVDHAADSEQPMTCG